MTSTISSDSPFSLADKKGLIVGIANEQSIAYGCAKVMRQLGAEIAITYLNDKAKLHVVPIAEQLDASLLLPCDVREPTQLQAVFDCLATTWGQVDFVVHSLAFAPQADLHGRVVDCSEAGFAQAMSISCHSHPTYRNEFPSVRRQAH